MTIAHSELQCKMEVQGTVYLVLASLKHKVREKLLQEEMPKDVKELLEKINQSVIEHLPLVMKEAEEQLSDLDEFLKNRHDYYQKNLGDYPLASKQIGDCG